MDPNVNLAEQLQIAKRLLSEKSHDTPDYDAILQDADRLAELVEALDEWMSKGGFKPCRWS